MEYTKMPIDIPEQISILKNRGLVIGDVTTALLHFSDISSVKERLLALLAILPRGRLKAMGFPEDWQKQDLWR